MVGESAFPSRVSVEETAGSVCFDLWYDECGFGVCTYKVESGINGFTRGGEHLNNALQVLMLYLISRISVKSGT